MILRMPGYCREFRCIADKCNDSCCIGWEIDIDSDTAELYEKTEGEFGERLRKNITGTQVRSFILGEKERCPFLNERNLCDIIINMGEESLCQICSDHPRYYEWFEGVKEGGTGLCCEEAARIILSQTKPFSLWEREVPDEACDEYDSELYDFLFDARGKIIAHLENGEIPLRQCICNILSYEEKLQEYADNGDYTYTEILSVPLSGSTSIRPVLEFMLELEPIDEKWIPYLKKCIKLTDEAEKQDCISGEYEQYLRNTAVYFVWRYFMKGVFDGEFLSRVKLMAVSVAVIKHLFACGQLEKGSLSLEECALLAKNYSKEVEYCEENLEALADASYEKEYFSGEYIAGLL
ncbi:MAG: hypothetical protein E7497_04535 [Ruminococcus sp.]|nr:hypothetical protein [Ruminococcus sp.]